MVEIQTKKNIAGLKDLDIYKIWYESKDKDKLSLHATAV